jgi:DNA-binding NarL/FixJ family response regulator
VAAGLTNKEIAKRLGVSPTTVKTHLERIFEKMQVSKRLLVAQKLSDSTSA